MKLGLTAGSASANFVALDDALDRVLESEDVYAVSNANAGAATFVAHTLGVVPTGVSILPEASCNFWSTANDKAQWTSTYIIVRLSTASTPFIATINYREP